MAITSYLIPAVAIIAKLAAAQCSASATTTISNPAGASALASCSTYSGDIVLATGVASNENTVDLTGLQVITGSLTYQNDAQVDTIQAGDLSSIGDFSLGALSSLSKLNMAALSDVGNLNFTGLSSLGGFGFGTPGITKAKNVLITNTILTTLNGINGLTEVTGLDVSNNRYLPTVKFDVLSVIAPPNSDGTGAIDIGANDVQSGGQTVSFPMLETADMITIRNASTIDLPTLQNVSQNLGFYGNLVTSINTPNLTFAGGIVIVDNVKLTNISMPLLTTINGTNGTYQIANNTLLTAIDGFEALTTVTGGLDFTGNFTTVTLPKLANVGGAMIVETSAPFDCGPINNLQSQQIVRGAVTCAGMQADPGSSTATSSGSTASSTTGAAPPLHIPEFMAGTSVLGMLLSLFL